MVCAALFICTGICNLAPLSLPVTVKVAYNVVWSPNNVLTPVALIVNVVPITVLDTLVPNVSCELADCAAGVSIPVATNDENNLTSEIVNEYPAVSYVVVFPK